MKPTGKTLIVVTGPTGSGKTDLAIALAQYYNCHIISADSRQIYAGLPIGTAAPSPEQLAAAPHHFVATLELDEYYSAAQFEEDVMELLPRLWQQSDYAVMCGGSMMYVDAVTRGIDALPTISPGVRAQALDIYNRGGLDAIRAELQRLDPDYYAIVDLNNHKRLVHAVEICLEAGVPYSTLRSGSVKERPFRIVKLAIDLDRPTMFDRINRRVDAMMEAGLEQEARGVYHLRRLNSLNTVGYKEMFAYFDGVMDLHTATERLKKNTRVYAKKQLTWLRRDPEIHWLTPPRLVEQAIDIIG